MADFTYSENAGAQIINFFRFGGPEAFIQSISFQDGAALIGKDYAAQTQILSYAENDYGVAHPISFAIVNDNTVEPDETFYMDATRSNQAQYSIQIQDDDAATLSVSNVIVKEGPLAAANFTVTLSNPVSEPVTVTYSTFNGSAVAGVLGDYQAATDATITIPANTTSATISIPIINDFLPESTETFSFQVTSVSADQIPSSRLSIGQGAGVATILDDDNSTNNNHIWRDFVDNDLLDLKNGQGLEHKLDQVNPEVLDQLGNILNAYRDVLGDDYVPTITDATRDFISPRQQHSQHQLNNALDFRIEGTIDDTERAQLVNDLNNSLPDGFRIYLSNEAGSEIIPGSDYPGNPGQVQIHHDHLHIDLLAP
ncbi:hypothetical protein G6321_00025715 [Bradyrhizobium barranii subsp. barranii]|uniref:Calx-beta domain-containing protein n=1 Tax=Bradyrhizobium barranii subsp. barranii TaxID=2823807 RepID=A0A7Z0QK38_9BRAD|nr:Calx-beta domain-containing protein [Bradyrhizobium barranii]UGX98330.1 hypothetical protein G6321_00025715 [Bradyrhizobium barranii subsp. barranii]